MNHFMIVDRSVPGPVSCDKGHNVNDNVTYDRLIDFVIDTSMSSDFQQLSQDSTDLDSSYEQVV